MLPSDCPPAPDPSTMIDVRHERDPFSPGLLREVPSPRKVIILKASRIGDFINATPAMQALKEFLPQAEFTLLTLPMLRDLAVRLPFFERILDFPGYPGLAEQFFDARRALAFFQQMQSEEYDLAIQLQGSGVYSNPFLLMLGARYAAGFVREGDPPGRLSAALPWPVTGHEARRNLALISFLGVPVSTDRTLFPLWPEDHQAAEQWLAGAPTPWIGIHTAARDWTRRWPLERFVQAAVQLQRRHGGTVIVLGEASERAELQSALEPSGAPFRNLAGFTTIPVSGAILQRLAVFLTNDTGPAHIAYAVGTPTVTIFGGGDPQRNGPLPPTVSRVLAHPVDCRPCETGRCPFELRCLMSISVEQVVATAEEIIRD